MSSKEINEAKKLTFDNFEKIKPKSGITLRDANDFFKGELREVAKSKVADIKNITHIETRNQDLKDNRHPVTGVFFERKKVELPGGEVLEGVFPKFDSCFDAKIPETEYKENDKKQFKECNRQLYDKIQNEPELAKKITAEQIEQIKDGIQDGTAPDGYVWHHNEEPGIIQLVDAEIHSGTGHTGGRLLWGGGGDFR